MNDLLLSFTPSQYLIEKMTQRARQEHIQRLAAIEEDVLEHHERCCCFCGFRENSSLVKAIRRESTEEKFASTLVVIPRGEDPRDLSPNNLAAACIFCAAPNSVNTIERPELWTTIYMPGVTQQYLSWVARALFRISQIKVENDLPNAAASAADLENAEETAFSVIFDAHVGITARIRDAYDRMRWYAGLSTISNLGQLLIDLAANHPDDYRDRKRFLAGFRVVPVACVTGDWTPYFKYRRLLFEATDLAGVQNLRSLILIARQAYLAVYHDTFPTGDPLSMEKDMAAFDIRRQ